MEEFAQRVDWSKSTSSAGKYVGGQNVYSATRRLEETNQPIVSRVMLDTKGDVPDAQKDCPILGRPAVQPTRELKNIFLTTEVLQLPGYHPNPNSNKEIKAKEGEQM